MASDLQARITAIFDYAYTSSSIRVPATTCREVGKILHAGMYAEEVEGIVPAFSFSADEQKLLTGNRNEVASHTAEKIKRLFTRMNKKWKLYKEDILFDDHEIAFITGKLNKLYIADPSKDTFGDALEIFRSKWAKQEGGQFFTDQRVTHLAIRMLDFNPLRGDDLVDICAGTGGFLLAGFNRVKEIVDQQGETEQLVAKLAADSLLGQEIDKDVSALGNGTLTARTGNYAASMIQTGNSLDVSLYSSSVSRIRESSHSCAATNPPFGAKIPVRDENILRHYDLAKISGGSAATLSYSKNRLHGRSPDVLFVERNIKLLKPGVGRLAIVIPYQILSGPQTYFIRDWLLKNAVVEAVIDLPGETFQPHTGTKTSLLVVRRRERPLLSLDNLDDPDVFMATPRWIGHDRRGNPIFAKDQEGRTTQEILSDFPEVEVAYTAFKEGANPQEVYKECFRIPMQSVLSDSLIRLNAQSHKPSELDAEISVADSDDWETVRLGNLVEKVFYPGRFKRSYVDRYDEAIPFLGGSNITELLKSTDKWLRHDDPKLSSLAVRSGWLLITRSGSTGIVSSVPIAWDGFAMSEHVIRIIPNPAKLDPFYLLAYLRTKRCQEQIKRGVFGSVIDEISPEAISNLEVPIPLDKKILRDVAAKMRKGEEARQKAIDGIFTAVDSLDDLLAN